MIDISGRHVFPKPKDWGFFLRRFAVYLAYIFVAAFLWAVVVAKPPLPSVEVKTIETPTNETATNEKRTEEGGSTTFEARLIAHSDGFWYVFNENSKKLETIADENMYRMRTPLERRWLGNIEADWKFRPVPETPRRYAGTRLRAGVASLLARSQPKTSGAQDRR